MKKVLSKSLYLYLFSILGFITSIFSAPIIYDTVDPLSPDYGKTITVTYHAYLHPGEYAKGFVKFPYGFTLSGTGGARIHVDVTEPVDGDIILNGKTLFLDGDLFLGEKSVIHGDAGTPSSAIESDGVVSWQYVSWGAMPLTFPPTGNPLEPKPWQIPAGGGFDRGFITKEGRTIHALNNVVIDGYIYFGQIHSNYIGNVVLNGHGNHLYFINANGFWCWWGSYTIKNIIMHGAADFNNSIIVFEDVTLDMSGISVPTSFQQLATITMRGNNKIIGKTNQDFNCIGGEIYLEESSSLTIGQGVKWKIASRVGKYFAVHFKDKSSTLILDQCSLVLGETVETDDGYGLWRGEMLQTSLTFSVGTVKIYGSVDVSTPKTGVLSYPAEWRVYAGGPSYFSRNLGQADSFEITVPTGFDLNLGGISDDTTLNLIINDGARLIAHDNVRVNILQ